MIALTSESSGRKSTHEIPHHYWQQAVDGPVKSFLARSGKRIRADLVELAYSLSGGQGAVPEQLHGFVELLGPNMNYEARYVACLGLSLTLITATALFALVGLNPKNASYQALPWLYAILSAVSATGFGFLAKRFEHKMGNVDAQLRSTLVDPKRVRSTPR